MIYLKVPSKHDCSEIIDFVCEISKERDKFITSLTQLDNVLIDQEYPKKWAETIRKNISNINPAVGFIYIYLICSGEGHADANEFGKVYTNDTRDHSKIIGIAVFLANAEGTREYITYNDTFIINDMACVVKLTNRGKKLTTYDYIYKKLYEVASNLATKSYIQYFTLFYRDEKELMEFVQAKLNTCKGALCWDDNIAERSMGNRFKAITVPLDSDFLKDISKLYEGSGGVKKVESGKKTESKFTEVSKMSLDG